MQLSTLVILILALAFITSTFAPETWELSSFPRILGAIKNLFSYFLYFGLAAAGWISGHVTAFGLAGEAYPLNEALMLQFLNITFHMTDDFGNVIYYNSMAEIVMGYDSPTGYVGSVFQLMGGQAITVVSSFYMFMFLLLFIMAIIYILMFLTKSDIKYSIYSVMSMTGLYILALFPLLIAEMLDLLGVPREVLEEGFITYFPGATVTNPHVISETFTAGAFWSAFFIYACLELSFQCAYVSKVEQPSIERTRRLQGQIAILGEKSLQFELEKQQEIKEKKLEASTGLSGAKTLGEKARITIKSFFSGGSIDAIRELLERRERAREREYLEEVSSDTRRLDLYIKRLFEVDRDAREALTAVGSAPSQSKMASSTLINMGIRLGGLLLLVLLVTNPFYLYSVFNAPPIVLESYNFWQPEAVVTALVPIAMLFPLVSFFIRTYKQYKLTQFQAQREEQSAMLKRLSELREIEEQETVIEESKKTGQKKTDSTSSA